MASTTSRTPTKNSATSTRASRSSAAKRPPASPRAGIISSRWNRTRARAGSTAASRSRSARMTSMPRGGPPSPITSGSMKTGCSSAPASSYGPALTISASRPRTTSTYPSSRTSTPRRRRPLTGPCSSPGAAASATLPCRPAAAISASSTWRASPRTATGSTSPAGAPMCRWPISCRTGTGKAARVKSRPCMSTLPATAASSLSTAGPRASAARARASTASSGTMSSTSPARWRSSPGRTARFGPRMPWRPPESRAPSG